MTSLLRRASIRTRILALVMVITAIALLLTSVSLLTWDYVQFRTDIQRELATQAQLVLENSTAAMSFQDPEAARETLETLSPNTHIRSGCLYTAAGMLFAEFRPDGTAAPCPAEPPPLGQRFAAGRVEAVLNAQLAGRPAGTIYLSSDLEALALRVRVQALTAAGVLLVALVVALLLSSVLQRVISEPIDALAHVARDVTQKNDYSLRARKTTDDELGVLVDAFNGMLGQIERAEQERATLLMRERDANRLKDEFLMTLSHELRTPLNAIQGWTRMLLARVIPADGVERALQKIERNIKTQTRLVEDLLEVSRFTTGKFRLERVAVDLVTIARQAVETVRHDADTRQIRIDWRPTVATAPIDGDPERLQQVIWNLLSNALKFSAAGSDVVLSIDSIGDRWVIAVRDSGIGIEPAFLPFVFEPFRQADASSTRAFGGLGLGLSIARRIADLHGGDIIVESPGRGQGATFTVRLPRVAPTASTELPAAGIIALTAGNDFAGLRILVVDDDPDTREILGALLQTTGASVDIAPAVNEALRLATRNPPDVLISDIAMPDLDGYALLIEMHGDAGRPAPKVSIALTAQATPADKERALAAGFDRHVAKPFDPVQFLGLLRELVGAFRN